MTREQWISQLQEGGIGSKPMTYEEIVDTFLLSLEQRAEKAEAKLIRQQYHHSDALEKERKAYGEVYDEQERYIAALEKVAEAAKVFVDDPQDFPDTFGSALNQNLLILLENALAELEKLK